MDQITAALIKADKATAATELTKLFRKVWEEEKISDKWKKGVIVKLPKKGDIRECNNWRGIILLTVPSKLFGRIIINRIKNAVDEVLRKEQAGRGTTEQIFYSETYWSNHVNGGQPCIHISSILKRRLILSTGAAYGSSRWHMEYQKRS